MDMKPFALHTVLKYRKQLENKAFNRLVEAEKKKSLLEAQLHEKEENYLNLKTSLEAMQVHGIDVNDLIRYEERIQYIKTQIADLTEKIIDADALVFKARTHVLTKSKEKQVMENLRDRQNLAYKQYLDKKEAAQMDEIAVMNYDRKR